MSSSAMNQPLINSVGIHAASETKQLSGKHDPLIASGTESKKSWTSVFLVESDHLERITSELLYKQDVLLADFARVLKLKRAKPDVPKGRPAIWTNLKPYILQNREAWDRAISNHGAISFDDELMDTPLKLFGAHIYQLYKSIARDEDLTTVTGNVLKWHPYYESFTDIERIFVVYRYRRFLNRISLDRGLALQRSADTSVGVGEESPSGKPFRACERFLEGRHSYFLHQNVPMTDSGQIILILAGGKLGQVAIPVPSLTTISKAIQLRRTIPTTKRRLCKRGSSANRGKTSPPTTGGLSAHPARCKRCCIT